MKLKQLNLREVAEKLAGVEPCRETTETVVKKHADGINHPTPDYVQRYLIITERAVGPNDWHELSLDRLAEKRAARSHDRPKVAA